MIMVLRTIALALLAGTGSTTFAQSPSPVGAAPEATTTPPSASAASNDPALGGRGELPDGRDATAAFSPDNAAAGAEDQSRTPPH